MPPAGSDQVTFYIEDERAETSLAAVPATTNPSNPTPSSSPQVFAPTYTTTSSQEAAAAVAAVYSSPSSNGHNGLVPQANYSVVSSQQVSVPQTNFSVVSSQQVSVPQANFSVVSSQHVSAQLYTSSSHHDLPYTSSGQHVTNINQPYTFPGQHVVDTPYTSSSSSGQHVSDLPYQQEPFQAVPVYQSLPNHEISASPPAAAAASAAVYNHHQACQPHPQQQPLPPPAVMTYSLTSSAALSPPKASYPTQLSPPRTITSPVSGVIRFQTKR